MQQPFQPYDRLANRTFIGFLIAEFLAAFNDQCIHASAMFFAIHTGAMTPDKAISLMPLLFYSPWALFCTLAGYFADRLSKRTSLIFWKVAEVGITGLALVGFWLGTHGTLFPGAHLVGPYIVLACVFFMGTHSAFYVPCKYGVLPEIFQPHLLSKANGYVESTSFLAVILGTATGGILSYVWKDREYLIGVFLVVSALIGTLTSFLIRRMPAADPNRPFPGLLPWRLYAPLVRNLKTMLRSRPLALALLGIAFFTFMVAFMRATMYMHGESQNPPWEEFKISLVVAVVALGIGLGSPLAGYLSGGKVELGLVPLGAVGMILCTLAASVYVYLHNTLGLVIFLACVGFCAGFYIVPLYTLMQHRAAKGNKGATVATSNFINVTGAITASLVFFGLVWLLHKSGAAEQVASSDVAAGTLVQREPARSLTVTRFAVDVTGDGRPDFGIDKDRGEIKEFKPSEDSDGTDLPSFDAKAHKAIILMEGGIELGNRVAVSKFIIHSKTTGQPLDHYRVRRADEPLPAEYDNQNVPVYLFAGASTLTLIVLLLLCRKLPDFFVRTLLWMRSYGKYHVRVSGMVHLPTDGPAILVTNCCRFQDSMHVLAATDRSLKFLLIERILDDERRPFLRFLARWTGLVALRPNGADSVQYDAALQIGLKALKQGDLVAISGDTNGCRAEYERLLEGLRKHASVPIIPVYCGTLSDHGMSPKEARRIRVLFGALLPADVPADLIQYAIDQLGHKAPQLDSLAGITLH